MPRVARATRSTGDLLRGLLALLLLVVLLVGIPASLIMLGAAPRVPSSMPSLDEIMDALTEPDDGRLLVATVTWIAWAGWLTLALSILVEIPAAVRGVPAPRLPALGPQQRLAAALVTAAALLVTAAPASLASSAAKVDGLAGSTEAAPGGALMPGPATTDVGTLGASLVHVVQRGDTLWDIAERYLGDGRRYPELYEASRATAQPDGRHLTDPDQIDIGWAITIPGTPAAAETRAPENMTPPPPAPSATVDAADPADPSQRQPPASQGQPGTDLGIERDGTAGPDPTTSDDVEGDSVWDDETTHDLRTLGGIGAVLAGGLLVYVGAQRARQHRHRQPGQRIALPGGDAADTEDALRRINHPEDFDEIDRALRTVAARNAVSGAALPGIRFARLIDGQFELYLAEPARLPAPFLPTANETLWVLDVDGDILDADQAGNYPAPYPALVTIGHDSDGGLILVDLEHVGSLALDATEPAEAAQIMAALAAELATSLWSDDLRVTTVGAFHDLAEVLDGGRIRHVEGTAQLIDELLAEVRSRAEADRTAFRAVGTPGLPEARRAGVAEGSWAPEILLIATPLSAEQQDRLALLVSEEPRVAVAAVTSSGLPLTEWAIHIDPVDREHAILEPQGLGIEPQRISHQDYPHILDLLRSAAAPASAAEPAWVIDQNTRPLVDGPPLPAEQQRDTDDLDQPVDARNTHTLVDTAPAIPLVAVLGPVEIQHAPPLAEPNKRGQLTALATYLALYPGQSHEAVDEALWPGTRAALATRNTAMTKLRNWLGADAHGTDYVPRAASEGYRLHPAIHTDWQIFQELLPSGPANATTADLLTALKLVRDQPFKGVNPRKYLWAERLQQEMIAAIGDVADELARRALHAGDHRTALRATLTGLAAEPGSEILWRHRLRAHHAANDRDALEQAIAQLTVLADELGGDLEDETTQLINELLKPTRTRITAV
jgi:DNA-binding SARP family transcriptional activator